MKKIILFLFIILTSFSVIDPSYAGFKCCACGETCSGKISNCSSTCACQSTNEKPVTKQRITNSLIQHREFLIKSVWEAHLLPSLMMMTEQISSSAMHQALIIGSLFDAKHQLETQRELQSLQAEAHADYQVSEGICEFGTLTRSLAATGREKEITQIALSDYHLQRQMLNGDSISGQGRGADIKNRFNQYANLYCNPNDLAGGLDELCINTNSSTMNKDINFSDFALQKNFNIDFTDPLSTADEADLISIQSNLYGHRLMPRIPPDRMATKDGETIYSGANLYLKMRGLQAKRNVAQASFSSFIAARAATEASVQPYFQAYLENMGIQENDVIKRYGDKPSYHSQMYLLTNKMYQSPKFYVDLYDKPENIDRKKLAIQAINLKLRHDMYDSKIRTNANQAILLETYLDDYEEKDINEATALGNNTQILELPFD